MAKRKSDADEDERRKRPPSVTMTLRVPAYLHRLLSEIAAARGTDMTSVVNGVIADAAPDLHTWLARHRTRLRPRDADMLLGPIAEALGVSTAEAASLFFRGVEAMDSDVQVHPSVRAFGESMLELISATKAQPQEKADERQEAEPKAKRSRRRRGVSEGQ